MLIFETPFTTEKIKEGDTRANAQLRRPLHRINRVHETFALSSNLLLVFIACAFEVGYMVMRIPFLDNLSGLQLPSPASTACLPEELQPHRTPVCKLEQTIGR